MDKPHTSPTVHVSRIAATLRQPFRSVTRRACFSLQSGFTLLEVMVALSILSIGIVTVIELFAGSLRLGTKASHRTQAVVYAQNLMDRFFSQEELEDGEEGGELPGGYVWQVRIQDIPPDEEESSRFQDQRQNRLDFLRLKEIEVRVSWDEGQGRQDFVLRSLDVITEQPQPSP